MRGHLDVEIAVAVEICDVELSTRVRRFPRVGDSFGRSEPPVAGRERKTHEKSSVKDYDILEPVTIHVGELNFIGISNGRTNRRTELACPIPETNIRRGSESRHKDEIEMTIAVHVARAGEVSLDLKRPEWAWFEDSVAAVQQDVDIEGVADVVRCDSDVDAPVF